MSPKQFIALLLFYIFYLLFGASVFYYTEHGYETGKRADENAARLEVNALLLNNLPNNTELKEEILGKVTDYCGKSVRHPSTDSFVPPYIWSFYHSFYFSFIICSTVGYGNISPSHSFGRIFLIFYAIVGLPLHAILFGVMGNFWGKTFVRMYKKYKDYKKSTDINYRPRKLTLIGKIALYVTPAIILLIFIPAILFTYFERWDYVTSVYYAFVTLTTIGFGDYAATFRDFQESTFGYYFVAYQIFVIFWFIAGVSYVAMCIGFLIQGLKSKQVKNIEHNLALNLKDTQKRLWQGMQRDVGFLRKILNEVNFSKYKPIYKDPEEIKQKFRSTRSQSCPRLFIYDDEDEFDYDEEEILKYKRKRANSETHKFKHRNSMFVHTHSDTELNKIDRQKTFEALKAEIEPAEILAKVTIALGEILEDENNQEDNNAEVQENEENFVTLMPGENLYAGRDRRALSVVQIPIEDLVMTPNEWTWSGANTQINELREKLSKPKKNLYQKFFTKKIENNLDKTKSSPQISNGSISSIPQSLNIFNRKNSNMLKRHSLAPWNELNSQNYNERRDSIKSLHKISSHIKSRGSIFSMSGNEKQQNLLETTTVADLIRAIEKVNIISSSNESLTKKLGYLSRKSSQVTLANDDGVNHFNKPQRGRIQSCVLENSFFDHHKLKTLAETRKESAKNLRNDLLRTKFRRHLSESNDDQNNAENIFKKDNLTASFRLNIPQQQYYYKKNENSS
ncbi:hypothetical protein PVAND_017298 [Polypedilum vanderplanki]|uniref:Potassium channel domain-containing protein n=1 Tax=Polypedilum vanderplanki TaxID=319348 RepID=A0A9J6BIN3_POLVA|nr:hypothetical protein PVAND_017298 [Polypedilum vanderplanki]